MKKFRSRKAKLRLAKFIWSTAIIAMAALAVAQVEPIEEFEPVLDRAFSSEQLQDLGEVTPGSEDARPTTEHDTLNGHAIQSISFNKDMTITAALRFLALKYQKNIIPSPNLDGGVTVSNLYNVTFEEALRAVLGENKFQVQGNFIRVYTKEEYAKDTSRMTYKVFPLNYITAFEAQRLVAPFVSPAGTLEATSPAELGISDAGSGGLGGGGGGDSFASSDAIVMHDYPENITEVANVLAEIDKKPLQVLVEATILSARMTDEMEYGVDFNLMGGVNLTGISDVAAGVSGTPLQTSGLTQTGNGLRVGITSGEASIFITALEEITDVTILANPKILAINKQEGSVLIGQKLGYRGTSSISSAGTEVTGEVNFLNTGTQLVFRPYINDDGYVRMDIYPKDSTAVINSEGVPDETTTELKTNIMVKDGETIVLGGLFRDVITTGRSQVPVFGSIPFVGAAFRSVSDTVQREEVIVMLTPHIITSAEDTNPDERAEDIRRKRSGVKEGLQWITNSRLAADGYVRAVRYYTEGDKEAAMLEINNVLNLRSTHIEALRLRERLVKETSKEGDPVMDCIMLEMFEQEDIDKWRRL